MASASLCTTKVNKQQAKLAHLERRWEEQTPSAQDPRWSPADSLLLSLAFRRTLAYFQPLILQGIKSAEEGEPSRVCQAPTPPLGGAHGSLALDRRISFPLRRVPAVPSVTTAVDARSMGAAMRR
ncbi:hypothetical protein AAFF_G00231520 [Aldrovandia affinis]|uniref:Uncharacterized protein n=1 Tax=Aldrovandia affinis TaxID=143900 RepID=A0AAD7RFD0_9TELE|nr:hypothetical protein AAFF_G00231520 [Aldrovandia affinis]